MSPPPTTRAAAATSRTPRPPVGSELAHLGLDGPGALLWADERFQRQLIKFERVLSFLASERTYLAWLRAAHGDVAPMVARRLVLLVRTVVLLVDDDEPGLVHETWHDPSDPFEPRHVVRVAARPHCRICTAGADGVGDDMWPRPRRRLCGVARWRICDQARRHRDDVGDSYLGAGAHEIRVRRDVERQDFLHILAQRAR